MKKRYWLAIAFAVALAIGVGAQNGFLSGAYFVNPTVLGTIPECSQFSGGLCVYSPSGLVDNGTILTYKGIQIASASGAVTQITAGTNVSISPSGGTGNVTVNAATQVFKGSLTFTVATTDVATVTGATSSSHCTFSPTNLTAAADILADFISTKATNAITITHSATTASGGTLDILCTVN
jgi:hypothetical protein